MSAKPVKNSDSEKMLILFSAQLHCDRQLWHSSFVSWLSILET
jgi:hypothetical protein